MTGSICARYALLKKLSPTALRLGRISKGGDVRDALVFKHPVHVRFAECVRAEHRTGIVGVAQVHCVGFAEVDVPIGGIVLARCGFRLAGEKMPEGALRCHPGHERGGDMAEGREKQGMD
jgi:hypothetical protein